MEEMGVVKKTPTRRRVKN